MNRFRCITGVLTIAALAGGMAGVAGAQTLPTISIQDASVTEQNGGSGLINFTVFLSKRSTRSISVQVQTSDQTAVSRGSGQSPFDYIESGLQALTFAPGDSTKQFAVTFEGDGVDEDNETFRVFLTNPSGATIGDGEATGTIIDDDSPPTLRIANASAAEGNGRITFPVTLSNPSGRTVTVAFATEAVTSAAASIAANCGGGTDVPTTSGTLSIPSGQTSATIDIPVCDDAVFEQSETFRVRLSSPVNASLQTALATGTILNDDDPTVSIASQVLAEGNPPLSGPIPTTEAQTLSSPIERQFTISLSGPTTRAVTVTLETRDGTANGGSVCRQLRAGPNGTTLPASFGATLKDYLSLPSTTVTIPAGRTSTTITVSTCRDFRTEENETFQIVLTGATNAAIGNGTATCTLNNDD